MYCEVVILGEPTAIVVTCASKYRLASSDVVEVTGNILVVSKVKVVVSPRPVAPLALYT